MDIYIEDTIALNFFITYLIIVISAKLLNVKIKNLSNIIASIIAAILAVLFPLIQTKLLLSICYKLISALIIVIVAFPISNKKMFIMELLSFVFITAILGGIIGMFDNTISSKNYIIIPLMVVFIAYITYSFIQKLNKKRCIDNFVYELYLQSGDREYSMSGFLDTGNQIYDNLTNQPIIIINSNVFEKLFPNENLLQILLTKKCSIENAHFIDIGTITSKSKMLIINIEKLKYLQNGEKIEKNNVCAGVSFSSFKTILQCDVILHPQLMLN